MRHRQEIGFPAVFGALLLGTLLGASSVGCEEANHDLADPPRAAPQQPVPEQPVTVDPVNRPWDTTDGVRVEDSDEPTDVNIGDGEIDIDAR